MYILYLQVAYAAQPCVARHAREGEIGTKSGYLYIHTYIYIYIYMYMYRERER